MKATLATQHIDPHSLPTQTGLFNLVAFLAIIAVTIILVIGIKESANFNSGIVIVKLAIVADVHRHRRPVRAEASATGRGQLASLHSAE